MESDPSKLILHGFFHILLAIPFALFLWKKTGSKKQIAILFLATIFVDLDHLVDYFAFSGFNLNIVNFLSGEYFVVTHKAFTPLHAWEWVLILAIFTRLRGWNTLYAALLLGLLPHIIIDSIATGKPWFYFLIFRFYRGFYFPDY